MKMRIIVALSTVLLLVFASLAAAALTPEQKLGKELYFDKHLSLNQNQACATCHHPSAKYADPLNAKLPYDFPVSLGSDETLNGGRNAPTSSYAAFIPAFSWNAAEGLFVGGQFWDGRAPTLKDQAKGPFLNPVEMAMADEAAVIAALVDRKNKNAKKYQTLFMQEYGIDLSTIDTTWNSPEVLEAYDKLAEAIGTYEQSFDFRPFTSKYDYYLAGLTTLNAQELSGLQIFEGAAGCNACHPSEATLNPDGSIVPPMFTDFTYDNLGIPKSSNLLIANFPIDYGLGARPDLAVFNPALAPDADGLFPTEKGKFRVSTLRNLSRTAPYGHNGFFATLDEIVHFYNTAGDGTWPVPEVADNVNRIELGNLGLTPQQEADLVAFLQTLTDGFGETMPANFVLPVITPLP